MGEVTAPGWLAGSSPALLLSAAGAGALAGARVDANDPLAVLGHGKSGAASGVGDAGELRCILGIGIRDLRGRPDQMAQEMIARGIAPAPPGRIQHLELLRRGAHTERLGSGGFGGITGRFRVGDAQHRAPGNTEAVCDLAMAERARAEQALDLTPFRDRETPWSLSDVRRHNHRV